MYDLGDPVPLAVEVKNAAGALTNATTIGLTITLPDGTTVSPVVANPPAVTGRYTFDFVTTQAGRHTVRWVATGPNAAFTDAFDVDEQTSTAIVSLADAKAHLNIPASSTGNDEELRTHILAASAWVEDRVGYVARRTVTGKVMIPAGGLLFFDSPVVSVSAITAARGYPATTYTVSDYDLDPSGVLHPRYGISALTYPVAVDYVAGRAVVPAEIRLATLEVVRGLWESSQRGPAQSPAQAGYVGEVAEMPGMGLTYWRAEQMLARHMRGPVVA